MARNPHSMKSKAEITERRLRAYDLSLMGWSQTEIAAELGVSQATVSKDISEESRSRIQPAADEWRQQSADRMRIGIKALMKDIQDERQVARSVEVLSKVEERLAKLLGLDAPQQQEVTAVVEHKPTEVLSLIERARRQVEEDEAQLREGQG